MILSNYRLPRADPVPLEVDPAAPEDVDPFPMDPALPVVPL